LIFVANINNQLAVFGVEFGENVIEQKDGFWNRFPQDNLFVPNVGLKRQPLLAAATQKARFLSAAEKTEIIKLKSSR